MIYKSSDYRIDTELQPLDLDGDGVFEFEQHLRIFRGFGGLCNACSPTPSVIFKYDKWHNKYLPASHLFPAYMLRGIKEEIKVVEELNKRANFLEYNGISDFADYLEAVLNVVVHYLYAGKIKEAWDYFEREYKLDIAQIRSKRPEFYKEVLTFQETEKQTGKETEVLALDKAKIRSEMMEWLKRCPVIQFISLFSASGHRGADGVQR